MLLCPTDTDKLHTGIQTPDLQFIFLYFKRFSKTKWLQLAHCEKMEEEGRRGGRGAGERARQLSIMREGREEGREGAMM